MTNEKLIERIKKLLALADPEKNDSQAQIEAALDKVAQLLEEHNLTMEQVEAHEGHRPITKEFVGVWREADHTLYRNIHNHWLVRLGEGIAYANYCIALYGHESVSFIGRAEDVKIASFMFSNLFGRLVAISKVEMHQYMEEYRECTGQSAWRAYGYKNARRYRKEWLEGAAVAIGKRLKAMRQEKLRTIVHNKDEERMAIEVAHDKALNQWLEEHMPWVKPMERVQYANGPQEAWKEGYDTGNKLQFQSGIEGKNNAVGALEG